MLIGADDEDDANALAERLRAELPGAQISVEANLRKLADNLPGNPFAFQKDASTFRSAAGRSSAPVLAALAPSPLDIPNRETTHITTSDQAGNVVAYTCSIEYEVAVLAITHEI